MSLYNMMHGMTQATFFVLPMLGKHADEYPRFRDCFTSDKEHPEYDGHIHVYTRTGGGNREGYTDEINEMRSMPDFVADFDDSFDSTYASFVFRVPEKWREDFKSIIAGEVAKVSEAYKSELYRIYPKCSDTFDTIFATVAATETDR